VTREEIAAWRGTTKIPSGALLQTAMPTGSTWAIVHYDRLQRLLDEREELLDAAKGLIGTLAPSDAIRRAALQEAIRKAESP